jgi:hypothetical protein
MDELLNDTVTLNQGSWAVLRVLDGKLEPTFIEI